MVYLEPENRRSPLVRFLASRALVVPAIAPSVLLGAYAAGKVAAARASGASESLNAAVCRAAEARGRRLFVAVVAAGISAAVMIKWRRHARPRPLRDGTLERETFFYEEADLVTPAVGAPVPAGQRRRGAVRMGPTATQPQGAWKPWPPADVHQVLERGYNTVGQTAWRYFLTEMLVGSEYPFTSSTRVVTHALTALAGTALSACGRVSTRAAAAGARLLRSRYRHADRARMYTGFLNTGFGCFLDFVETSETYGDVVVPNAWIPFDDQSMLRYEAIVFHLDHATATFVKATLVRVHPQTGELVREVWGSADAAENTHHALYDHMTRADALQEQLHQAALIAETVLAFYSHSAVHWWANGAALVSSRVWPAVSQSVDVTQWMNTQAVFGSWCFFGNEQSVTGTCLAMNSANGLPLHRPTFGAAAPTKAINWAAVLERSRMHRMNAASRVAVRAALAKMAADAQAIVDAATTPVLIATLPAGTEQSGDLSPIGRLASWSSSAWPEPATAAGSPLEFSAAAASPFPTIATCPAFGQMDLHDREHAPAECLAALSEKAAALRALDAVDLAPPSVAVADAAMEQRQRKADAARALLREVEVATHNLDVILASTVMHAADHHYVSTYFPLFGHGYCDALRCDVSGLTQHLMQPIDFRLWTRLVFQLRLAEWRDPVSSAIYEACRAVDPTFADTALMIGCAV